MDSTAVRIPTFWEVITVDQGPQYLLLAVYVLYLTVPLAMIILDYFLGDVAFRKSEALIDACLQSISQQVGLLVASAVLLIFASMSIYALPAKSYLIWQLVVFVVTFVGYFWLRKLHAWQRELTRIHIAKKLRDLMSSTHASDVSRYEQLAEHMIDPDFRAHSVFGANIKTRKREAFLASLPRDIAGIEGLSAEMFMLSPDDPNRKKAWRWYRLLGAVPLVCLLVALMLSYMIVKAVSLS